MNITFLRTNSIIKFNGTKEYYELLRSVLKIKKIVGKNFVRIGRPCDGGYIMVDNLNISEGANIAYSFGISDDISWDWDIAKRSYDVFMYDPTINNPPKNHDRFHFFKKGIAGIEIPESNLNTLESFIRENGHEEKTNMILKMDVEGAEWSFLSTVTSEILSKFDQIVFEMHFMIAEKTQSEMNATFACLKKINKTHSLVHLHSNNSRPYLIFDDEILFPSILELTYVKTSNYELVDDENIYLPIPLDRPNNLALPDIPLGFWNKKFNNVMDFKY